MRHQTKTFTRKVAGRTAGEEPAVFFHRIFLSKLGKEEKSMGKGESREEKKKVRSLE